MTAKRLRRVALTALLSGCYTGQYPLPPESLCARISFAPSIRTTHPVRFPFSGQHPFPARAIIVNPLSVPLDATAICSMAEWSGTVPPFSAQEFWLWSDAETCYLLHAAPTTFLLAHR